MHVAARISWLVALVAVFYPWPAFSTEAVAPVIEMAKVKGGCFQMGDTFGDGSNEEKPVHEVCLADFQIGKYEVTQAQWQALMGNNRSEFRGEGRRPVENVNSDDVQQFIAKLNQVTGKQYRLPTEAEWEYAARSGGKKEKWSGTGNENQLESYAWYDKNSDMKTSVVGKLQPNGLGLYDMSGNVWEWCADRHSDTYYKESPRENPQGPQSGSDRVIRGGGWFSISMQARTSSRAASSPSYRSNTLGFRLALPAGQ